LLFIDIDRFKQFNDTHGHAAGDRVLTATALVINRSLNRPLDLCCRWGGEEFLALLPETTAEEALFVAERIRKRISIMKLKFHGKPLSHITLSIGIAATMTRVQAEFLHKSKSGMDQRITPEDLIARADKALLQAKELGRDRVIIG
jgi:diguanylate cyclase (GGDEF)-like protein